jgi:hypothetical protein
MRYYSQIAHYIRGPQENRVRWLAPFTEPLLLDGFDAKNYFDFLLSVVNGTQKPLVDSMRQEAAGQLLLLFDVGRQGVTLKESLVVAPMNWERTLNTMSKDMNDLKQTMESRTKEMVEILGLIYAFMEQYKPVFDEADKLKKQMGIQK